MATLLVKEMESLLPFGKITNVPFMTEEECLTIYTAIYELKKMWSRRHENKYTLGAASYIDANTNIYPYVSYYGKAKLFNPILQEHFGWLYQRLGDILSKELKNNICYQDNLALPGFHIFISGPKSIDREKSLHVDFQGKFLKWDSSESINFHEPISFTLAIKLPECGGGLDVLDMRYEEYIKLSPKEQKQIFNSDLVKIYPYKLGDLLIRSGNIFHEVAAMPHIQLGEERITLQGHGLLCQDTWYLYW
ncbi:hypothetical protein GNF10_27250 [Nostoc sp. UCD121]|uniref:hypothetical protein n=1 Tax=unclassified Nostoc TaxID=2593658 RepID=UPI001626B5C8|nr:MULTISPECIES: hypothetical protein [unclassified Nostoc]MBC1224358.1 hypothetical protein [Nostoc sp. UCD120]MBC1279554.1 hypothetical protein [Nostoc sp. UCD121]MBC1296453.1 hypothetical protein [Nostoc sp. UCD122]